MSKAGVQSAIPLNAPQDWARRLIGATGDFVCLCSGDEVLFANDAAAKTLGHAHDGDLVGRGLSSFIHPDYCDVVVALLDEIGGETETLPIKFIKTDGSLLDAELLIVGNDDGTAILQAKDITERLRTSAEILESEKRYRELVDCALDLICVVTDGMITFINPAGIDVLAAQSVDDLIGREVRTLIHPDYAELSKEGLGSLIGEIGPIPLKMVRLDGDPIDVEISVIPFGPDPSTYMMEVHDITAQLQSANEIRDREQTLRGIMQTVADGLITIDEDSIIQSFNPAAEDIFGYAAREVIGESVEILMADHDRAHHQGYVDGYRHTGKPTIIGVSSREQVGRRKDGTVFPIELAVTELKLGDRRLFTGVIRDITDRKRNEEALRMARDKLEERVEERTRELTQEVSERRAAEKQLQLAAKVIENLNEGVVVTDADFVVTSVNRAFNRITGFTTDEIVGEKPHFYTALSESPQLYATMWHAIDARGRWQGELWNKRKDGTDFAERLSVVALTDRSGAVRQFAIVTRDITQRKQDEERIRYQANYDALTGLPNRSLFMDRLAQALPTMRRAGRKLALMFLDLDGFKLVNDTLGHDVGDLLLQETAHRISSAVRDGDTVARLGGDEFTVIMPNLEDPKKVPIGAKRILDALAKPYNLEGHEAFVSGSIGITIFPDDADIDSELIKNADAAMYQAKEQGKDTFQFYTADLNDAVKQRLILKNGLSKALEREEFELFYQPKLDLTTGRITSVEALLRWTNPELGAISPVEFIPLLEETGMVIEVGEWALRVACAQHKAWLNAGLPAIRVAVNLSARQLREPDFVDIVERVLAETNVGPEGLELEITESMLMSDASKAVVALEKLHDRGLHIAMDDFGTGYSSLSYLKRFPIDTIKIDRSFVSDIATNPDDAEIIRTIITMGHTLNRKIVAEGVEDENQLSLLRDYQCDEIQGYFISRPLPADQATAFIRSQEEGAD